MDKIIFNSSFTNFDTTYAYPELRKNSKIKGLVVSETKNTVDTSFFISPENPNIPFDKILIQTRLRFFLENTNSHYQFIVESNIKLGKSFTILNDKQINEICNNHFNNFIHILKVSDFSEYPDFQNIASSFQLPHQLLSELSQSLNNTQKDEERSYTHFARTYTKD